MPTSSIDNILKNNQAWATKVKASQPDFFTQLLDQQSPQYMWIGCSDSRVPANEIMLLAPGEVFVHRNIANVVVPSDLNALSTIQFAVEKLRVKDVLVVGHYGCAGVHAALNNLRIGLADNWIRHIQNVRDKHTYMLHSISPALQENALCELNALEQTLNVAKSTVLQDAWDRGQVVGLHSLVYALNDGLLRPLGLSGNNFDEISKNYTQALQDLSDRYLNTKDTP